MAEQETVYPNDTTNAIRKLISQVRQWSKDSPLSNGRETSIVLTKLEEAELFSLRMVKQD